MVLPKKPTKEELEIYHLIVDKFVSKLNNDVYKSITNPLDKMIVYYVFDQGYSINDASKEIGIRREVLWLRKKTIRLQLREIW